MTRPAAPPTVSRRPTPESLTELTGELANAMATVAVALPDSVRDEWVTIVNFIAVAQRILARTNPSKIKEATQTVWIQALIPVDGKSAEDLVSIPRSELADGQTTALTVVDIEVDLDVDSEHEQREAERPLAR